MDSHRKMRSRSLLKPFKMLYFYQEINGMWLEVSWSAREQEMFWGLVRQSDYWEELIILSWNSNIKLYIFVKCVREAKAWGEYRRGKNIFPLLSSYPYPIPWEYLMAKRKKIYPLSPFFENKI